MTRHRYSLLTRIDSNYVQMKIVACNSNWSSCYDFFFKEIVGISLQKVLTKKLIISQHIIGLDVLNFIQFSINFL